MKGRTSCEFMLSIMSLGLLGGAEGGSRLWYVALNPLCDRVRAAEHASRGPFRVLERRHGLVEIVERGGGVVVERLRVNPPCLERAIMTLSENASRHGHCSTHQ